MEKKTGPIRRCTRRILQEQRPTCGAPLLPKRGYLDTAVVEDEETGEGAGAGAGGDGGALLLATIWLSREAAFLTTLWTTPIFSLFRRAGLGWAAAITKDSGGLAGWLAAEKSGCRDDEKLGDRLGGRV